MHIVNIDKCVEKQSLRLRVVSFALSTSARCSAGACGNRGGGLKHHERAATRRKTVNLVPRVPALDTTSQASVTFAAVFCLLVKKKTEKLIIFKHVKLCCNNTGKITNPIQIKSECVQQK